MGSRGFHLPIDRRQTFKLLLLYSTEPVPPSAAIIIKMQRVALCCSRALARSPGLVGRRTSLPLLREPWWRTSSSCAPSLTDEEKTSTEELNRKLADAASQQGAQGVVEFVDKEGERFTESNVTQAIHSFAASIKAGDDVAALSKSPGFQVLIGELLLVL